MAVHYIIQAINWLEPIIEMLGLCIAVWAFLRCRKRAYLIIALYFVLMLFMAPISRMIRNHRGPTVSEQTREKISEAVKEATDRVLVEQGYPKIVQKENIRIPFGSILLVLGVWLLAKNETNKIN